MEGNEVLLSGAPAAVTHPQQAGGSAVQRRQAGRCAGAAPPCGPIRAISRRRLLSSDLRYTHPGRSARPAAGQRELQSHRCERPPAQWTLVNLGR